jgi:hypothetical protein
VRKKDIKIGHYYAIRHSNERSLTVVQVTGENIYGGYDALKLKTKRTIRIKSAAKMRYEVFLNPKYGEEGQRKWLTAPTPQTKCEDCNGSGIYHGRGYVENGQFKGFTGPCFRCEGKGHQTEEDRKRNWGYDNFHRKINL